ncbi:hypothetical protein B296_00000212 [Ensete ventricosum]|uniref:Uncharacterized protein n=1 Tax=Ensete ventricosum TaxID=4639 RepID=A0A427B097_ENSVE|nr:hypothetical protein B296_00000212 [Ensete ventricosum]
MRRRSCGQEKRSWRLTPPSPILVFASFFPHLQFSSNAPRKKNRSSNDDASLQGDLFLTWGSGCIN